MASRDNTNDQTPSGTGDSAYFTHNSRRMGYHDDVSLSDDEGGSVGRRRVFLGGQQGAPQVFMVRQGSQDTTPVKTR